MKVVSMPGPCLRMRNLACSLFKLFKAQTPTRPEREWFSYGAAAAKGKQFIVVAIGGSNLPAERNAFSLVKLQNFQIRLPIHLPHH